jgi:hypothetical protein
MSEEMQGLIARLFIVGLTKGAETTANFVFWFLSRDSFSVLISTPHMQVAGSTAGLISVIFLCRLTIFNDFKT